MKEKPGIVGPVVVAIAATLFCLYVAGYFALGERVESGRYNCIFRNYNYEWLAYAYLPLTKIESAVTGERVEIGWYD